MVLTPRPDISKQPTFQRALGSQAAWHEAITVSAQHARGRIGEDILPGFSATGTTSKIHGPRNPGVIVNRVGGIRIPES